MVSCKIVEKNIDAMLDGRTDKSAKKSITAKNWKIFNKHLSSCEQCQKSYKESENVKKALGILRMRECPPDLEDNIKKRIAEQEARKKHCVR